MQQLLNQDEGKTAVNIARKAVEAYVTNREKITPEALPEIFSEKRGVFVTLKKHDMLRGCIGYIDPIMPLSEAIIDTGISSSTSDPRFSPVQEDELPDITVEVTILTPPEKIECEPALLPQKITIGKHGLIAKSGPSRGLLLPQVAPEHGMDEEEFLSHTCMKAGLPASAWLDETTEIYCFEGQIFTENEPMGGVVEKKTE